MDWTLNLDKKGSKKLMKERTKTPAFRQNKHNRRKLKEWENGLEVCAKNASSALKKVAKRRNFI